MTAVVTAPIGGHELDQYQATLPVRLIATPRKQFVVCTRDESLAGVIARNVTHAFDHLPVEDEDGKIVGVLDMEAIGTQPGDDLVGQHCVPLAEGLLIGSEVSILEFLEAADKRPFRFLITKDGVGGLVSLSDIQRLPVRAALFATITQFEMAMADLIQAYRPDETWVEGLSEERRKAIERERRKARRDRNELAGLMYTVFSDKAILTAQIACDLGRHQLPEEARAELDEFRRLRNALAHAKPLGATRSEAAGVAIQVRAIRDWISWIEHVVTNDEEGSN